MTIMSLCGKYFSLYCKPPGKGKQHIVQPAECQLLENAKQLITVDANGESKLRLFRSVPYDSPDALRKKRTQTTRIIFRAVRLLSEKDAK